MAMALGQGQRQWGNGNCNGTGAGATGAMGQWGATKINRIAIVLLYVVMQRKTSTIVVDKTVQNVWTANIHNVFPPIEHT
jgi:hypothetical protein